MAKMLIEAEENFTSVSTKSTKVSWLLTAFFARALLVCMSLINSIFSKVSKEAVCTTLSDCFKMSTNILIVEVSHSAGI